MGIQTREWQEGYTTAMVFLSDIFESRSEALYRRGIRRKDIKMIVGIIDAAIRARNRMAQIGPRNMDLIIYKDNSAAFIERNKNENNCS